MSPDARILLCSYDVLPAPSGLSIRLTANIAALAARYDVVVVTRGEGDLKHIERYHGARLLRIPPRQADPAARIEGFERALVRQLESEEYAVVHASDPVAAAVFRARQQALGYRMVYELHAPTGDEREAACLSAADRVVVGSRLAARYAQSHGADVQRIRMLRTPALPGVAVAPAQDPLGPALYLGSGTPEDDLDTLLEALALMPATPPAKVILAGPLSPATQAQVAQRAAQHGVADRIEQPGPVQGEALEALLRRCALGLLPRADTARNRDFGGALGAASVFCGAGLPLIASDLELTRGLCPAQGARFFRPGDAAQLAEHWSSLMADPQARAASAAACRDYAARQLDPARIQEQLLEIYEELLALPPP